MPRGSIVDIGGIAKGVLADDLTINLTSNFKQLAADFQNSVTELASIVGAAVRSVSGIGFSLQAKQMTTQIWNNTEPLGLQLNIDFHRFPFDTDGPQNISGENVMNTVKKLCAIALPKEHDLTGGWFLEPPGPSFIEGIGLDSLIKHNEGVDFRGIVDLTLGNFILRRMLMRKAEPTFSKYTDDSDYPISCRVAFDFISIWAATKQDIWRW